MNTIQRYETLLISAQKAQAHPAVIARYAFLYNWACWKAARSNMNRIAALEGLSKTNRIIRKYGHRMAMHYNQLKRMGDCL